MSVELPGRKISATIALALALLFMLTANVRADDGGISFGGSPHILSGHPSISMASEDVRIDVGEKMIKVDCKFLFHNSGPASTVRMGFPDQGLGAEEPYQGEPLPNGPGLHGTFLSYESTVDGKKVATKVVSTNDRALFWHTKTVTFKGHSDCRIEDVYRLKPGAQVTSENGMYHQTYYVLHTGSSWHGPIGKAEITVTFEPGSAPAPLHLVSLSSLPTHDIQQLKWSTLPTGTVVYEGPVAPALKGRTVKFICSNIRPTKKDDVHLFYDYKKLQNMN